MANPTPRSKPGSTARSSNQSNRNIGTLFGTAQGSRQASSLFLVDRDRIQVGAQPRQEFAPEDLESLANSIRELRAKGEGVEGTGILQPLLVTALPDGRFQLIAGERRWRASGIAGLPQVPVVVGRVAAPDVLITQLIENLQRADLSPLEEAQAVSRISAARGLSVRDLAKELGKNRGWVENRLKLLKVGEDVRAMLQARPDSIPHAFEIDNVTQAKLREQLIALVLDGVSVARVRQRIDESRSTTSADTAAAEDSAENSSTSEMPTVTKDEAPAIVSGAPPTLTTQFAQATGELSFQNDSQAATAPAHGATHLTAQEPRAEAGGGPSTSSASTAAKDPLVSTLRSALALFDQAEQLLQEAPAGSQSRSRMLQVLADLDERVERLRRAIMPEVTRSVDKADVEGAVIPE
jgi:ParB family chromosome partitioning protein